jgi:hypothetical protein
MMPKAVEYSATEMPWASCCGLVPACCEEKDLDHPDDRAQQAQQRGDRADGPEQRQVAPSSCATWPPATSTALTVCSRGAPAPRTPAAKTKPRPELLAAAFEHVQGDLAARVQVQHVVEQVGGQHARAAQRHGCAR